MVRRLAFWRHDTPLRTARLANADLIADMTQTLDALQAETVALNQTHARLRAANHGELTFTANATFTEGTFTEGTIDLGTIDATAFGDEQRMFLVRREAPVRDEAWYAETRARQRKARQNMEKAVARSAKLLQRYITKKEWEDLQKGGWIRVKGKHIIYTIDSSGRVETQKPYRGTFCVYPADQTIPHWDRVLTLKLWIEGSEEEFLREANWSDHENRRASLGKIDITGEPTVPFYTHYRREMFIPWAPD